MNSLRRKIVILDAQISRLQTKRERRILSGQCRCLHRDVFWFRSDSEYFYSPEYRICVDCGLVEEGWGHGYYLLDSSNKDIQRIGDDSFNKLGLGSIIEQRDHEGLGMFGYLRAVAYRESAPSRCFRLEKLGSARLRAEKRKRQ